MNALRHLATRCRYWLRGVRLPAACIVAFALAGCSALQVDVDVYKGPLVSQREVQLRQFAMLALAAKPLLAELRNDTEKKKTTYDVSASDRAEDMWRFHDYPYQDDVARFANGALSYYDDVLPALGLTTIRRVRDLNDRFQAAQRIFAVSDADCDLAQRLAGGSALSTAVIRFLRAGEVSGWSDKSVKCGPSVADPDFATSSAALGKRRIEHIWQALCAAAMPPEQCADQRGGTWTETCLMTPARGALCMPKSVSDAYTRLGDSQTQLARRLAEQVAPAGPLQDRLRARLLELGKAFSDARGAMLDLWPRSASLLEEAARVLPPEKVRLTAAFLANTTEPRILACYLHGQDSDQGIDPRVRKEILDKVPKNWSGSGDAAARTLRFREALSAIASVARSYPVETARSLQYVHDSLRRDPLRLREVMANCPHYAVAIDARAELLYAAGTYGLARGTAVENNFDEVLASIVSQLATLTTASRYSFDEGRSTAGIVSLTKNYLDALTAPESKDSKAKVVETRRLLQETLIPFAERLLFVANNAPLLNRGVEQDAELARKTAVLQAVGNTLIVLVDDIRRQVDHDAQLQARRLPEAIAVNQAFAALPGPTYDALVSEVAAQARRLQAEVARLTASKTSADAVGKAATTAGQAASKSLEAAQAKADTAGTTADKAIAQALRFRAAAIALGEPSPKVDVNGMADDAKAGPDRKVLVEKLGALPKGTSGANVLAALRTWIDEEIAKDKPGGDSQRLQRLTRAQGLFADAEVTFPGLPDGDPVAARDEIKRRLADWQGRRESAARQAMDAKVKADAVVKTAQDAVNGSSSDAKQSQAMSATLAEALATTAGSAADRDGALQAIRDVKVAVLAKAGDPETTDALKLKELLLAELKAKEESSAKDADLSKRYRLASAYVTKTTPTPRLKVDARDGRPEDTRTQRDVLDDLIAHIRQQRLQALAAGDTERAASYESALKAAFEQRGTMAYLRPTAAYLRNVYAATAVQSDPEIGFTNMLTGNVKRLLGQTPEYALARASVEKQFWQNINTVQVNSAGASNYVLVKDDVGNWYLKAVASDTNAIIQSAQSLALFNLGKKFDVNLLRRVELQRRVDAKESSQDDRDLANGELRKIAEDPGAKTGAAASGLAAVRQRYKDDYAKSTAGDVDALRTASAGLNAKLVAAWKAALKAPAAADQQPLLEELVAAESTEQAAAGERLDQVASAKEADRAVTGADAIIDALRSLRRWRDRLSLQVLRADSLLEKAQANVATAKKALDEAKASKDDAKIATAETGLETANAGLATATSNRSAASDTVRTILNGLIAEITGRRLEAVRQADTAYSFIGEAATAK